VHADPVDDRAFVLRHAGGMRSGLTQRQPQVRGVAAQRVQHDVQDARMRTYSYIQLTVCRRLSVDVYSTRRYHRHLQEQVVQVQVVQGQRLWHEVWHCSCVAGGRAPGAACAAHLQVQVLAGT